MHSQMLLNSPIPSTLGGVNEGDERSWNPSRWEHKREGHYFSLNIIMSLMPMLLGNWRFYSFKILLLQYLCIYNLVCAYYIYLFLIYIYFSFLLLWFFLTVVNWTFWFPIITFFPLKNFTFTLYHKFCSIFPIGGVYFSIPLALSMAIWSVEQL